MRTIFITLLLATVCSQAASASSQQMNFDVLLDGKEVGFHRFHLEQLDDSRVVRSEAEFRVKVLFLTAFHYQHNNVEIWEDNCLRSIDAETDSNGRQFEVKGTRLEDQFLLQAQGDTRKVEACVATFAYWDRDLLTRERLLNSQTGEYLDVSIVDGGEQVMQIGASNVPVRTVKISAADTAITVAYAAQTGDWVALDSQLKNGRTLSYRRDPTQLPGSIKVSLNND